MFSNDMIFGETMAKKFSVGDIVSWPELDSFKKEEKIKKLGIITEIVTVLRSERPVILAKVLDMETSRIKDILIVSLNLVSKANKEIQN